MLTLGIDPGMATMGYGLVDNDGDNLIAIDYGVITTPASMETPKRLNVLFEGVTEIIARYKPEHMALEQLFFAKNAKTILAVGQARGVVVLAGARQGLSISEYTPLQVKQSVSDYGRGDKSQVQAMVKLLLRLKEIPQPDDAADALAVAICHMSTDRVREIMTAGNKKR